MNQEAPRNVKDIQGFLRFANFYRRFIIGFLIIAGPLTELTRKDTLQQQTKKCQSTFNTLKRRFLTALILAYFRLGKQVQVETNTLNYVVAGVLSQMYDSILRPIAFYSKRIIPAECNYDIYDKELLAIIKAFEEQQPKLILEIDKDPINVLSDYKNLEYFITTKRLNARQARQLEFLLEFNF